MMKLRTRKHLFDGLRMIDELHEECVKNPTEENLKHYKKVNRLFINYLKNLRN